MAGHAAASVVVVSVTFGCGTSYSLRGTPQQKIVSLLLNTH